MRSESITDHGTVIAKSARNTMAPALRGGTAVAASHRIAARVPGNQPGKQRPAAGERCHGARYRNGRRGCTIEHCYGAPFAFARRFYSHRT